MRDSYKIFFDRFGITTPDILEFGIRETIFADPSLIQREWEFLKDAFSTGGPLFIRGAGRNGRGTGHYIRFYKSIINLTILEDPTNNTAPARVLKKQRRNAEQSLTI